jgi:hypothetical protein
MTEWGIFTHTRHRPQSAGFGRARDRNGTARLYTTRSLVDSPLGGAALRCYEERREPALERLLTMVPQSFVAHGGR